LKKSDIKMTPMMQQYMEIKSAYQDAVLLYRLGDFYESFFEDAKILSKELQLVLTSRNGYDMAGVPYHAIDGYLKKLVKAGYKVAICDQVEAASQSKGIVKREVTRVVTPGTVIEDSILEYSDNSFMAAVVEDKSFFVTLLDVSTGQSYVFECESWSPVQDVLLKYSIVQLILPQGREWEYRVSALKNIRPELYTELLPDWYFNELESQEQLKRTFSVGSVEFLELPKKAIVLYGALLKYLEYQKMSAFEHLTRPVFVNNSDILVLDATTVENLNLINRFKNSQTRSLFDIINYTSTAMGSRKLKEWLLSPLRSQSKIYER